MTKIKRQDYVYVGVDLHKEKHVAVITDCFKEVIATFSVENAPAKFKKFLQNILKKAEGMPVIFGLEDVTFYGRNLAMFLLGEKQIVKEVNSSYTKRERNRNASPDKTDTKDAEGICSTLIDKINELPNANPQDIYLVLKQVLSLYENLNKTVVGLKNSFQNQLIQHYPLYKKMFKDIASKSALAFFERFPSPNLLEGQTSESIVTYLRQTAFPSFRQQNGEKIISLVQENGWREIQYQEQSDYLIRSYIKQIRSIQEQMKELEESMDALIQQTGYPLQTMSGIDTVTAATIISDIGDINRYSSAEKVAKLAGIAPTNRSSGNSERQTRNRYGKRRLNKAFYYLALQHICIDKKGNPRNPLMYEYYQKKKKEGRNSKQAMVYVMRRLVNIVYSMMKNKTPYIQPSLPQLAEAGEAC